MSTEAVVERGRRLRWSIIHAISGRPTWEPYGYDRQVALNATLEVR